ncbi:hypothetical protein [Streptomyces chumphonensis]|uniref:hypothetical protein n=1 Tax=Streptomyces chumphonensis TaxID=1214925 RepID=UPI003D723B93
MVAALTLGSLFVAASPAQAAEKSCPRSGYISNNNVCTTLSNGVLSHQKYYNSGAYTQIAVTQYWKSGGSRIYKRLGFTGPFTNVGTQWQGWGYQYSGTNKSFSKNYLNSLSGCRSSQGLMEVSGSTVYKTPWSANC